jgi:hypothetical protein
MKVTLAQLKTPILQSIALAVVITFVYQYLQSNPLSPSFSQNIFHTINLVFHEAGHTFFVWAGDLIYAGAGSFFQILVPVVIALYFLNRNELFETSVVTTWVAANIYEVGIYMKDSKERVLPLLGDNPDSHDWYTVFSQLDILSSATNIGNMFISGAFIVLIFAVALGIYTIWAPFVLYGARNKTW